MSVSIKRDRATGKNLGYGFVKLSSHQEARTAKEAMQVRARDQNDSGIGEQSLQEQRRNNDIGIKNEHNDKYDNLVRAITNAFHPLYLASVLRLVANAALRKGRETLQRGLSGTHLRAIDPAWYIEWKLSRSTSGRVREIVYIIMMPAKTLPAIPGRGLTSRQPWILRTRNYLTAAYTFYCNALTRTPQTDVCRSFMLLCPPKERRRSKFLTSPVARWYNTCSIFQCTLPAEVHPYLYVPENEFDLIKALPPSHTRPPWPCFVVMHLQGVELGGRRVRVGWAQKNTSLYVSGLNAGITTDMLVREFARFGPLDKELTTIKPGGEDPATTTAQTDHHEF